ncbi:MAG: hypothetical protein IIC67_00535 [Thaumarchaeota archaeon]|nr:hypothetical protein [Nitrososphaerota archaeon]
MRVVFIGPTGVNLKEGVEKLADFCRIHEGGLTKDQLEDYGKTAIATFFVEDHIPLQAYLDLDNLKKKQEIWETAVKQTLEEFHNTQSKHYFVGLHLPHYRNDKFFPVPNIQLLNEFQPDMLITLIDDVHICYQRIKLRDPTRSIFTMRDILLWRSVSIYVGDTLAYAISVNRQQLIKNYVVAVKHPPAMFQKLIFRPEVVRSYCSFSITRIRDDQQKKQSVNDFRNIMHNEFCIFDPLTIDDRLYQNKYEQWKVNGGTNMDEEIIIEQNERWDLGDGFSLVNDTLVNDGEQEIYPIKIRAGEIYEIAEKKISESGDDRSVIDNHIRERDFRLIDQSNTMVAFRPQISGKISDGVSYEAHYISQVNPKPWFYVWPDEDGQIKTGPFKAFIGTGTKFQNKEELIAHMKDHAKELTKVDS